MEVELLAAPFVMLKRHFQEFDEQFPTQLVRPIGNEKVRDANGLARPQGCFEFITDPVNLLPGSDWILWSHGREYPIR